MAEVGGALGVPFLGACSVGKLGERYLLTFKVISIEESKVMSRAMKQVDDEGDLVDAVRRLVKEVSEEARRGIVAKRGLPEVAKGGGAPGKEKRFFSLGLGTAGLGALVASRCTKHL